MKKQINALRFLTLAGLLTFTLLANANNVQSNLRTNLVKTADYFSSFTYSWSAEPSAVSYTLEIENTVTQEVFNWTTTDTSISAFSVPNGTYNLKVIAHLSNLSDSIIIEEVIIH